ncbi:methyltransferase domain-containing protein [Candidatus Neomarinimicrobiota bacterium]
MQLIQNPDKRFLLHIWRTGTSFEFTNRYPLYMEWNNIKFSTLPYLDVPPNLYHYELRKPLPFEENTFDAIYCNHVFEHLTHEGGIKFSNELNRVLKPGGICRVVVPDLESAAREYLKNLEEVLHHPFPDNKIRYEWGVADLIDQMVRLKPGGMMGEKLTAGDVDWDQIKRCNGDVFESFRIKSKKQHSSNYMKLLKNHFLNLLSNKDILKFVKLFWYRLRREYFIKLSKKSLVELYNEKNLWMYDHFSLPRLLKRSNFVDIQVMDFNTSKIDEWSRYNFDQSEKGNYPLEPSVYVEGSKK